MLQFTRNFFTVCVCLRLCLSVCLFVWLAVCTYFTEGANVQLYGLCMIVCKVVHESVREFVWLDIY